MVCGLLVFPLSARSATFVSYAEAIGVGCQEGETNSTGASSTCGSVTVGSLTGTAYSSSGDGRVSARATSLYSRDQDGVLRASTGYARSFATISDGIQASYSNTGDAFDGTISISLDLLGNLSSIGDDFTGSASATFSVNNTQIFSYDSTQSNSGPDAVPTLDNILVSGRFSIFSYAFAEAFLRIRPSTDEPGCAADLTPITCFSDSDLGSSLRITGISFFDGEGKDVTDLLDVVSESGFDYVTGDVPHDRGNDTSVVPLPGSIGFLAAGFLGLGVVRQRSRQRTT